MDIDNESFTSTATTSSITIIHQDDEADINQMAEADANAVGDGNDSDCEHDGGNAFSSERDWEHLIDDLQDEENDDGRTTILEGAPPGCRLHFVEVLALPDESLQVVDCGFGV